MQLTVCNKFKQNINSRINYITHEECCRLRKQLIINTKQETQTTNKLHFHSHVSPINDQLYLTLY